MSLSESSEVISNQSLVNRNRNGLSTVVYPQPLHDLPDLPLSRGGSNEDSLGDFFAVASLTYESQYLPLPLCESCAAVITKQLGELRHHFLHQ